MEVKQSNENLGKLIGSASTRLRIIEPTKLGPEIETITRLQRAVTPVTGDRIQQLTGGEPEEQL